MSQRMHLGLIIYRKTMKNKTVKLIKDVQLEAAKQVQQELSRSLVRSGKRSQESMFLISTEIAKTIKIRHRTDEF